MPYKYPKLDKIHLLKFTSNPVWDHGNNILYSLVKKNFRHSKREEVLTKVLFIGRIYAAALERRKETNGWANTEFYTSQIWPRFQKMDLDRKIDEIKKSKLSANETVTRALLLHGYLMQHLHKLTKLQKRSFASKYLHFHLPHIFFLYDSRALAGIRRFEPPAHSFVNEILSEGMDEEYAKYFCRCTNFLRRIKDECGISFTPRGIDNLLMYA